MRKRIFILIALGFLVSHFSNTAVYAGYISPGTQLVFYIAALGLALYGGYSWAKLKGRHWAWMLTVPVVIGLLILPILKDRRQGKGTWVISGGVLLVYLAVVGASTVLGQQTLLDIVLAAAILWLPLSLIAGVVHVVHLVRERRRLTGNPDALALSLLAKTPEIVRDIKEAVYKQMSSAKESELPGLEDELCMLWLFLLDYWLQKTALRDSLQAHMAQVSERDHPALLERFNAYGQAVNDAKGNSTAVFTGLGDKLAEFSGMPTLIAWTLSPMLFTKAGEVVLQEKKALKL